MRSIGAWLRPNARYDRWLTFVRRSPHGFSRLGSSLFIPVRVEPDSRGDSQIRGVQIRWFRASIRGKGSSDGSSTDDYADGSLRGGSAGRGQQERRRGPGSPAAGDGTGIGRRPAKRGGGAVRNGPTNPAGLGASLQRRRDRRPEVS